MTSTKLLASIFLVLAVVFAQVGNVAAAPQTQETTISGTVTNIGQPETDGNGATTVLVTMEGAGGSQTVRISLEYAVQLGLIDPTTQQPVPLEDLSENVTIDPNEVIPDEEPVEPDVHPISALLADFFFNGDPEMASLIDSYHTGENDAEQVFGFGVIAQALWMSKSLSEDGTADADLAGLILQAKKSGDYSAFELPDGSSPTNWGQFKKALLHKDQKNLGLIVSGRADNGSEDSLIQQDHGNGKNKDKGKGKDKHNNHP